MNTYSFKLQRGTMTKEMIQRAVTLQAAKGNIEDQIEEGWKIVSIHENGKLMLPPSKAD